MNAGNAGNAHNINAYYSAVEMGKYGHVKRLSKSYQLSTLITGASIASDRGHFRIVNLLLDMGVPPRIREDILMINALRYGHTPTVKRLHEAGVPLTGLLTCVYWGYKPCFDYHLDQGVDINYNYGEALQMAIGKNATYYIDRLLDSGAVITYHCLMATTTPRMRKYLADRTGQHEAVFLYACDLGDKTTVGHIAYHYPVDHLSGIMHATEKGHLALVRLLDRYVGNHHRHSIMTRASVNNHYHIINHYVESGTDPFHDVSGSYTNNLLINAVVNHNVMAFQKLFEHPSSNRDDDEVLRWCFCVHSLLLIDYVLSKRTVDPAFCVVEEALSYRNQFMVEVVGRYYPVEAMHVQQLLEFCDIQFVVSLVSRMGLRPVLRLSEFTNKYAQVAFRELVLKRIVDIVCTNDCQCPVCFGDSVDCQLEGCGHQYHRTCVESWLENSNTCPSCRAVVI